MRSNVIAWNGGCSEACIYRCLTGSAVSSLRLSMKGGITNKCAASSCHDPRRWRAPEGSRGPYLHSAVDCVGAAASVGFLMDNTDDVVALFGVQREEYRYRPAHNRLRLCGYRGHSRESAEYALELVRSGALSLAPLVTHRMPLERYGEAVDLLESRRAVKVCFLPWEQ